MTPLDAAHGAMEAAPEDDAARLRFWGALIEAELFVMLATEAAEGQITPAQVEVEGLRFVLAFDREERLAAFAGGVVPYAALSGRRLAGMLAGCGLGVALNPDVAPSAMLVGAEAVEWLAARIGTAPVEVEARIAEVFAPADVPEAVLAALDRRLGLAAGMAQAAWLVGARGTDGARRHVLALVGVTPGAEAALVGALAEALRFSGVGEGAVDLTCLAADAPVLSAIARVGLRFELPQSSLPAAAPADAMAPARPPRLR